MSSDDRTKLKVRSMEKGHEVTSQKELDDVFKKAQNWLSGSGEGNGIEGLYNQIKDDDENRDDKRLVVISKVLDYIELIQKVSLSESASANANPDLVSISLPDMKLFNRLMNILIIEGIYPCLSTGIGIPLELRFKGKRSAVGTKVQDGELLYMIMSRLNNIITTKGDVRDIILLGTYSTDLICGSVELAYNPERSKADGMAIFKSVIDQIDTFTLFTCYASLLRPGVPLWFKSVISRNLALIPVNRNDGVRCLLEFIGGLREREEISINELDKAVRILRALPKDVSMEDYQKVLSNQFVGILSNIGATKAANNLIVASVHVLNSLYKQRPQLISKFANTLVQGFVPSSSGKGDILTSEYDLNNYLTILSYLIKDPQPLLIAIRGKIITSLWLLLTFLNKSKRPTEVIVNILTSLLNIDSDSSTADVDKIVRSLLITSQGVGSIQWNYGGGPNGGVEIKQTASSDDNIEIMEIFTQLDGRIELFLKVIENVNSKVISGLFITIVRRWLTGSETSTNPFNSLVDLKLIQKIVDEKKEHLMKSPTDIIELILSMIDEYVMKLKSDTNAKSEISVSNLGNITKNISIDSDDEGEEEDSDDENDDDENKQIITLCLSLITGLIMEDINEKDLQLLKTILPKLEWILQNGPADIHDEIEKSIETLNSPVSALPDDEPELTDSIDIYNKAISSLDDAIIPIKAHGLHLLRTLIKKKDPILSVENALRIFIAQLKDEDSFIYLNSIKGLEELSDCYGYKSVLPAILGHYSDPKVSIDERLKTGEVILRIIQRLNELSGDAVQMISETLLSIISVRSTSANTSHTDDRLRMSAMSILGAACEINPLGVGHYLYDIVDCAMGILTFETKDEMAIMRRSAVVLIGSLLKGIESLEDIPKGQIDMVMTRIRYVKDNDSDALVRVQAGNVIDILEGT